MVEKPEWYLKKNVTGQVPLLEWIDPLTKETKSIAESLVVCDYLDEIKPDVRLHPADPYAKAKQRILVDRFSGVNRILLTQLRLIYFDLIFILDNQCFFQNYAR